MDFSKWLQEQLDKRGWNQRDLVRHVRQAGYELSPGQLSRIINRTREANPEACIGIAHALGISREEVFRARGWLFTEEFSSTKIDPRAERLAKKVSLLAFENREITLDAMEAMLESAYKLSLKIKASSANGHENQN